jgi:hypothetical protein
MKDILDSMELNELANLEDLAIDFSSLEPYNEGRPLQRREGRWVDTEPAWIPLEKACAARNVICIIRHPELVLPVGDSHIPCSYHQVKSTITFSPSPVELTVICALVVIVPCYFHVPGTLIIISLRLIN